VPWNFFLLPLLGGYCLIHIFHFFRFRAQRLDGYRLLLECGLAGVALTVASRGAVSLLNLTGPGRWLKELSGSAPIPYAGTALGALIIGVFVPFAGNFVFSEKWAKNRALKRNKNLFVNLLHNAASSGHPIQVTLDNRKWYMGIVNESPNLDPQEQYFRIIPILSGYRDAETLQIVPALFYEPAYATKDKNDFAVTIPVSSVKLASLFDRDAYLNYFARQPKKPRPEKGGTSH